MPQIDKTSSITGPQNIDYVPFILKKKKQATLQRTSPHIRNHSRLLTESYVLDTNCRFNPPV